MSMTGEESDLAKVRAAATSAGRPPATSRWRLAVWALLLILIATTVFVVWRELSRQPELELPISGRLAVLPFANATSEAEHGWVEVGLMRVVADTLAATSGIAVVAPERLLSVVERRGLDLTAEESRLMRRRLAFALGADLVLEAVARRLSSKRDRQPLYGLDYVVRDVDRELAGGRFEGPDLVSIGAELSYTLGLELARGSRPMALADVLSRSHFLTRLYAMGLDEHHKAGAAAARPFFDICLRAQPRFLAAKVQLAHCQVELGELQLGRGLHQEILRQAQERGDRRLQADSLVRLAQLASREGDEQRAQDLFSQAFTVALNLQDRAAQAEVLGYMTEPLVARGQRDRALELLLERVTLERDLGDLVGQAETLLLLAELTTAGGDLEGGRSLLVETTEIARRLQDVMLEMEVAVGLGKLAQALGESDQAIEHWQSALRFFTDRGDPDQQLQLTASLGAAYLDVGDIGQAEEMFRRLLALAEQRRDPAREALAAMRLTQLLLQQGYPRQARRFLDRALALDRWIEERIDLQILIARVAYEQGNFRLAAETQKAARRQAGEAWSSEQEAFLRIYEQAQAENRRLPLPGA